MLSGGGGWSWGRGEGFLLVLRGGGVLVLCSLIGCGGPERLGRGVVWLTPDVTGHVGRN